MTDKELLDCLTDRPCAVCRFHEEKGCTKWGCVFDQREQEPKTDGDCISRQIISDYVESHIQEINTGYGDLNSHTNRILRMIVDYIEKMPKAGQEPKTQWIPVSEELPENIRPVMVTWKNNDPASYYQYIVGKHFIGVAHYLKGKWYWYSSTTEDFLAEYGKYEGEEFDEAIEVVAWCPLPEPYKKSEVQDADSD